MPPWTAARGSNSRFGMCSESVRQKTPNLFRPLDPVRLQPVADPPEEALLLEMEPAFALLGVAREHVLESAERSLACDRDIEQLPQLGVGDGPDEFLHVAVALVRVLRLDGQEPAGRVLLDLLDRQRQLFFVLLTEAEHHPRFGVEHPGEFAALILERPAELFQVELQLLRHQRGLLPQNGLPRSLPSTSLSEEVEQFARNLERNAGRSAAIAFLIPSKTPPSTPAGLSGVFSRNGGTEARKAAFCTRSDP